MQVKTDTKENIGKNKVDEIVETVLKALGLAMGTVVVVLSVLGELETESACFMLGLGLAAVSITLLKNGKNE